MSMQERPGVSAAEKDASRRRLFLALWPAADAQQAAHQALPRELRSLGRRIPADKLHITLAFLGPVDGAGQACVEQVVADCVTSVPAFALALSRLGYFPRPRVLWLGAGEVPGPLRDVLQCLRWQLKACGFEPESRPFQPHVTLLRKAGNPGPLAEIAPVLWPVDAISLVESKTLPEGAVYKLVKRWPLSAQVCDNPC